MSGSPRANAQTCHEYGQDDRDRGGGYAELSHRQPQPDELIQDTAEAGNEEEGKVPARADARRPCLRIGTLGPNLNRMNFYFHVNGFCAHKLLRFRDLGWGGWENPAQPHRATFVRSQPTREIARAISQIPTDC